MIKNSILITVSIDYAMAHCQQLVTNQNVFPTKYEHKFSAEFNVTISKMLRLLWHVICT